LVVYLDLRSGSWKSDAPHSNNGRAALIDLLNGVIDNTYLYTVDGMYRQTIGIPMGGCASSLLASLYCSWRKLLYVSALDGITSATGVMPAKGGNALLSDAEVKAAVDYIVAKAKTN
jgi:hypothetical protein